MVVVNDGLAETTRFMGSGLAESITGNKWEALAVGSGSAAATAGQTSLSSEITGNGLGRQDATGSVQDSLGTDAFVGDTQRYENTWNVTGSESVQEFAVFNTAATGQAGEQMFLRQVFSSPLNLVADDTLTLTVDVSTDAPESTTTHTTGTTGIVFATEGLKRANQLSVGDVADPNEFVVAAVGADDGVTLALDRTNNQLGNEFIGGGLARNAGTASTVTATTENVTGDSLEIRQTWSVTTSTTVREAGVFDTTSPPTGTGNTTTSSSGNLLMRTIFEDSAGNKAFLNLIDGDTFEIKLRAVNS